MRKKEMQKRRNTVIELFRFLFTICVIVAHLRSSYDGFHFSWNGHIAVEFFFVLSGYLMTFQCYKDDNTDLATSTWRFMRRKIAGIAPVWYTVLAIMLIIYFVSRSITGFSNISTFITRLVPTALFLSSYGMQEIISIPFSWYIPVMLVSMLILYPVVKTWKTKFTRIVAPLIVLFFCSWAMITKGKLFMLKEELIGFVYPQQIRGLAELCMGCVAYELSCLIKQKFANRLTISGRVLASIISVSMLTLPIVWLILGLHGSSHTTVLLMFAIGVAVSFSGTDLSDQIPRGGGDLYSRGLAGSVCQCILRRTFPDVLSLTFLPSMATHGCM